MTDSNKMKEYIVCDISNMSREEIVQELESTRGYMQQKRKYSDRMREEVLEYSEYSEKVKGNPYKIMKSFGMFCVVASALFMLVEFYVKKGTYDVSPTVVEFFNTMPYAFWIGLIIFGIIFRIIGSTVFEKKNNECLGYMKEIDRDLDKLGKVLTKHYESYDGKKILASRFANPDTLGIILLGLDKYPEWDLEDAVKNINDYVLR